MGRRATINDIAAKAGVGVATVDRVLNGRAPVSQRTAACVLEAAEALNYHAHGLVRRRIEEMAPAKTLGFILQKPGKWFYRTLAREIEREVSGLRDIRAKADIRYVARLSPDALSEEVLKMRDGTDALALVSLDHPKIARAIADYAASGRSVFALLSPIDAPDAAGYIGIDGYRAGRTAGWAMSRLFRGGGEIGVMIGSRRYRGHEALETGFRDYMREFAPGARLRDTLPCLDDSANAYEAAAEILCASPELGGLYHCGGGVEGAVQALREAGRGRDIAYVCHEKSPAALEGLRDGTVDLVIASDPGTIAGDAVRAMVAALTGNAAGAGGALSGIQLVTPENL